jgi:cysteine sulfinate desulfinase/cysteine desulfurase-like protein
VFGDPPWGHSAGDLRTCAACGERAPRRLRICPFCEQSPRAATSALALLAGADKGTLKVVGALLLVFLILGGSHFAGQREGTAREDAAKTFLDFASDPSAEAIKEERERELARQDALKAKLAKLRPQLDKAKPEIEEAKRLKALLESDPREVVEAALSRRDQEFRRLFPESR